MNVVGLCRMRQTDDKIEYLVVGADIKIQYLVKNGKKILTKIVGYGKIKMYRCFLSYATKG